MSLPLAKMFNTTPTEASQINIKKAEEEASDSPKPKSKRRFFIPSPPKTKLDKIKDKVKKDMHCQMRKYHSPPSSPTHSPRPAPALIAAAASAPGANPLVYFSRSSDSVAKALSNFAESWFKLDGRWWPTVEHYYQAHRWPSMRRDYFSSSIRDTPPQFGMDPRVIKAMSGKTAMAKGGFIAHADFEASKVNIMERALQAKFKDEKQARILLSTKDRPLRHHERCPGFWGCHSDRVTGLITKGLNTHGQLLEKVRLQLRAAVSSPTITATPAPTPAAAAAAAAPTTPVKAKVKKVQAKAEIKKVEETAAEREHRLRVFAHLSTCNAVFTYSDPLTKECKKIYVTSFYPHQPTAFRYVELSYGAITKVAALPAAYQRLQISSLD